MKVAVIIDTWLPVLGGGQTNALEISKRIVKRGVLIDIITRNCGNENLKYPSSLKVFKLGKTQDPTSYLSKIKFLAEAFFYVSKKDYDIVHAQAFLPGITAKLLTAIKGIPSVFTIHGTSIGTNLTGSVKTLVEKIILFNIRYSAQITVSKDLTKFKNVNKNLVYISNGVNVKDFDSVITKKNEYPTLLFVGRLHPQKNLKTLLESLPQVLSSLPNLRLFIVGKGEQEEELKNLVKKLKLKSHIIFKGELRGKELKKIYKSSHLFILPSIYEGQPLTLLEAWAAKIPAITTRTGDCQYLVRSGQNGYLLNNPPDPREIADVIKKAFYSKNLETMGTSGYNFVKKNFSWDQSAAKTLAVYKSLING